jgi:hypothetical protein
MAALAAIRAHGAKKGVATEDTVELESTELPGEKDREFDVELGLLTLNG